MKQRTSYNYLKLLGRLREVGMTQEQLSATVKMDKSTLNLKLNNKSSFRQNEIRSICAALHIPPEEIGLYFFTH